MVHRPLDHQRLLHGVAETGAPVAEVAQAAGEAAHQVVDRAGPARAQLVAQGGLVLVEAVAHGHAHLPAGAPHLVGDAYRRFQGVGDRLLGDDVHVVRQRSVDYGLVEGGRHHHGADVGGILVAGALQVGIAPLGRQAEMGLRVVVDRGVDVHRRHHFQAAAGHVRRQKL